MSPTDVSMRVIADHARATTFCIADGVVPSTKGRGYVLRRIMRRAMRHGKRLGIDEPFFHRLVDVLVREMGEAYPELGGHRDYAVRLIRTEEERFESVLTNGLPAARGGARPRGRRRRRAWRRRGLPAVRNLRRAARLHRGHGRGSAGVAFDAPGFEEAMEAQKEKARAGSAFGLAATGSGGVRGGDRGAARHGRPLRGLHRDAGGRRDGARHARRGGAAGRRAGRRPDGLRRARPHAVLRRVGRPGVGHRNARERRGHARAWSTGW